MEKLTLWGLKTKENLERKKIISKEKKEDSDTQLGRIKDKLEEHINSVSAETFLENRFPLIWEDPEIREWLNASPKDKMSDLLKKIGLKTGRDIEKEKILPADDEILAFYDKYLLEDGQVDIKKMEEEYLAAIKSNLKKHIENVNATFFTRIRNVIVHIRDATSSLETLSVKLWEMIINSLLTLRILVPVLVFPQTCIAGFAAGFGYYTLYLFCKNSISNLKNRVKSSIHPRISHLVSKVTSGMRFSGLFLAEARIEETFSDHKIQALLRKFNKYEFSWKIAIVGAAFFKIAWRLTVFPTVDATLNGFFLGKKVRQLIM